MQINPIDVAAQLQGPHREAHRLVHAQLEASQQPGQAIFFPNADPDQRRPDVLVALEGQGYLTIHIATEPHGVDDGWLVLVSADGEPMGRSPLCDAAKDAVALSQELRAHLGCRTYLIPVILFMDEGRENALQAWAMGRHIATLFTPTGWLRDWSRSSRNTAGASTTRPTPGRLKG